VPPALNMKLNVEGIDVLFFFSSTAAVSAVVLRLM
jgi:hypothetical protein